ncbi:MAG: YtoQ family protein [Nitrospira sp.]|nr:YtoQ family protein [bacterium]MBL7048438.1 YtoQ family protein [Nitrospira sp.]
MSITVYLAGEIHSDWREDLMEEAGKNDLYIEFTAPVTDHEASDAAGDQLGAESSQFWRDHKSAKVNAIRTRALIDESDIVVIKFGDKYRQWNAAFDAGYCSAIDKPYITLHSEDLVHPLKEIDAAAQAWAQTPAQVVEILKYIAA